MAFKKPYGARQRKSFTTNGPSMTHQSFKQECDINFIMRKYQRTGLADHVNQYQGDYSDLTDVPDYHEAMNKILSANEAFSTLSSSIRKKFSNDPAEFLDFVSDPENESEMREMGLLPSLPAESFPVEDTPNPAPVE